jgi:hypothetical protein
MAAGNSFALWIRKYPEKKARCEKGIAPEPLLLE